MMKYCQHCKRMVDFKRRIGFGSIVMIILTGFFWLLAIPFYRKRCKICASTDYLNKRPIEEEQNKE